ncbi:MAG: ribonuclease HII [Nocardioides sp.]|uniref:ribonuclease HII n=1 Tax=Nocardioides sp. TaxID=35761 RepID=UPI0039E67DBF
MRAGTPTLRVERAILRGGVTRLAACDEVGRGALCGPVSIGVVVVDAETRTAPAGVRDSKLLTPAARMRLAPKIRRWARASGVGHASSAEIDRIGLMAAMRLAGQRALAQLDAAPDALLLDGNHDYLSPAQQLFEDPADLLGATAPVAVPVPPVTTMIKADLRCAAVAAASILAKTERDALMVGLHGDYPDYGWEENKGYASPGHLAALAELGPSPHHRLTWKLPVRRPGPSAAGARGRSNTAALESGA